MRDGFISVAAGTPKIRVADCRYNAEQIFTLMREADKQGVKVLALPELCLTGYTCGDLFLQDTLLRGAEEGLQTILEATRNLEIVTALGLPVWDKWDNKLYNCAAIIQKGEILGLIPKVYLPNYGEFYEQRWFASGSGVEHGIELCGQHVSLCTNQTFACDTMPNLVIGVEICEDLWAPAPPSVELARKGATVILNLSASNELVGKADYRRSLVTGQSARLMCGYVYADAGEGESTTDVVFTGHNMIAENGTLLAERRFATGLTVSEIDVDRLIHDRRRTNTFTFGKEPPEIWRCGFTLPVEETRLTRYVSPSPFVPEDAAGRAERCEEILRIASLGLKKRLEHTGAKTAVVGLSGGLDSSLVCAIAAKKLKRPIRTFAIGMERDAIDLKYARQVAAFLHTDHTEVLMDRDTVVQSLEDVIAALGTFDITTIRASVGMYLLCRAIHAQTEVRVLLTGEVSDELFGYKYTDYAPDAAAFQRESQKRVRQLHCYDVLRADRCIAVHSLEARVPFGDLDFVRYVMAVDPEQKRNIYGKGKYLLRKAFEGDWLPEQILWREKAAFSDAVGHSMVDDLKAYAEQYYTDAEFEQKRLQYDYARPFTKESLLYRELFERYYPGQAEMIPGFWMPNRDWAGCDVDDPSARVLQNYGESGV